MVASATSLLMASWVWLVCGAVIGFWLLGAYNRLVRLRGAVVATFPSLEVQLRKRHGLVQALTAALATRASTLQGSADAQSGADVPLTGEVSPPPAIASTAEAAAEAVLAAAQALDRMGRRMLAGGVWSNLPAVVSAEQGVDLAVDDLVSRLQASALDAPLAPAVAESLDRLQRVRKPIGYCLEVYNEAAEHHNAALRVFPTSVAARLFQFKPATLLALARAPLAAQSLSPPHPG